MHVSKTTDLTNEAITDESVPDPTPLPEIPGWKILIRPIQPDKKVGSILLPDSFRQDVQHLTNIGRVLKVGDIAFHDPNSKPGEPYYPYGMKYKKPWCKVGDYVIWKKFQGSKFLYQNVHLLLLADDEIEFLVKDPRDFNLMFNVTKLST